MANLRLWKTICLVCVFCAAAAIGSRAQTFTSIDVPGALGTFAYGINPAGAVTGTYFTTGVLFHGFLRAANGTIATFDAPGAGTGSVQGTFAFGINLAGAITGYYIDASNVNHGFVRAADGTLTSFDAPGAFHTFPNSIDPAGEITGHYLLSGSHGFVRAADGTLTTFDAPGGATRTDPLQCGYPCGPEITTPASPSPRVNLAGVIAGDYQDASSVFHGFLRGSDGTLSTFDAPGAGTGSGQGIFALSVNPQEAITG